MRNQYKKLFDGFAPVREDEELFKAVLGRKAEKKKGISKKIFIPVIAAAVLGTTAIGASAAYQWNHAQAIEQTFEENSTTVDYPTFDLYKLGGKELHEEIRGDGFTLKTIGISADEHSAYMFYDIIFDEDFDYSLSENEVWMCGFCPRLEVSWVAEYWGPELEYRDSRPHPHIGSGSGGTIGSEGNVIHMHTVFDITGITLPGKTLNYELYGLYRYNTMMGKIVGDDLVEDIITLPVDIDFETVKTITVAPNERIGYGNGDTGTIEFIQLSPFTLNIDASVDNYKFVDTEEVILYDTNGKFKVDSPTKDAILASLKVKFKDGTVKDINAFCACSGDLMWEYPVNIDMIESVTVCGCEVKIN